VATPTVHLHCYFEGQIAGSLTAKDYFAYLRGSVDPTTPEQASLPPTDRFADAGVNLDFRTTQVGGVIAFQHSLRDSGSVVIYLGHSALDFDRHYSLGLTPRGLWYAEMTDMDRWNNFDSRRREKHTGEKPLPPEDLMSALKKSAAKLVILASCGSATIPNGLSLANFNAQGAAAWKGKVAGGPAVVVTHSTLLTTWSNNWAWALAHFLFDLIDYEVDLTHDKTGRTLRRKAEHDGSIQTALDAANAAFKNYKAPDSFVLVNGTGSTVVFP
jgi:hypothetical protein